MSMSDLPTVSAAELGRLLALTDRHVRRLRRDGVLPGAGSRYDIAECVPAYVRLLREGAAGSTLADERLGLMREKRRALEIANDVKLGRLLDVELVEQKMLEGAAMYVGGLNALPARVASACRAEDRNELVALIQRECHAIRAEIAAATERRADEIDRRAAELERQADAP